MIESDPKISVIIPTYNREEFIGAAIDSVLNQSFVDFELIVVDDGSTDMTKAIIYSYSDERLIYIYQKNQGRSAARNRAIELARGEYIAFLDSDDFYLPNKLQQQMDYMRQNEHVDMVYTSADCIDAKKRSIKNQKYIAREEGSIYNLLAFFRPVTITLPTVMIRRNVLDKVGVFDVHLDRFEDTDMWRRISKHHFIGAMPQVTCLLTTHNNNSLENQDAQEIVKAVHYYVRKVFKEDGDLEQKILHNGASQLYEYYGRAFLGRQQNFKIGASLIYSAIFYSPRSFVGILIRSTGTYIKALLGRQLGY